jgi:hypothetical protein
VTEPVLRVDPQVLQTVGSAFGQAGDALAGLGPDTSLSSAAAGVPALATAAACRDAQVQVSTAMTAVTLSAHQFGESLVSAAAQYSSQDQAAAGAVNGVQFPK